MAQHTLRNSYFNEHKSKLRDISCFNRGRLEFKAGVNHTRGKEININYIPKKNRNNILRDK